MMRLAAAKPLTQARDPFDKQIGTCRDFAAMLTAFARAKGYDARVRCGFATYFGTERGEDHWIVEYRTREEQDWKQADAQLDPAHRAEYGISFDISDLPKQAFVTAELAWQALRSGTHPADFFGHRDHRGETFLFIDLVRDALAQADILTSLWESWRNLSDLGAMLPADIRPYGDDIGRGAVAAQHLEDDRALFDRLKT